jgi:hypothetical protein
MDLAAQDADKKDMRGFLDVEELDFNMKIKKGMQLLKTIVEFDTELRSYDDDVSYDSNSGAAFKANATTELYSIFNGFARASFPLGLISRNVGFNSSDKVHPIVGSHSELIKVLKPETEEYDPYIVGGEQRSDYKHVFMMRYVENVAICDALPTLEEAFYVSDQKIQERNDRLYQERFTSELNWSKSHIRFKVTVVGRKERIADEKYPELHLDSKNYQVYW